MVYFYRSVSSFKSSLLALFIAAPIFSIACSSVQPSEPRAPTPGLDRFPPPAGKPKSVSSEEKLIVQELRAIEASFVRRNCGQIREHTKRLEALKVNTKSSALPVSTVLALALCDAEAMPADKTKFLNALTAIDMASRNLEPWVNGAYLENLKAELYLAQKDRPNALKSKKRERLLLASQDQALSLVDAQILELTEGTAALSDVQKAKFKEASAFALQDDKLFVSISLLDELLASLPTGGAARTVVLGERARVVGRVEQLFTLESSEVEDKKSTNRDAEAKEQANLMRNRYPTKIYGARIDLLMGISKDGGNSTPGSSALSPSSPPTTPPAGPASAPPPVPSNSQPLPGTAAGAPLSETQVVDKALADAKGALDTGNPQGAVDALDALPENLRTDRTRRLRREAAEAHVRDLRIRVRDLYNRATAQPDKQIKLDSLKQCKQILETILAKYPETPGRSGVDRNLKTISQDIEDLGKAK